MRNFQEIEQRLGHVAAYSCLVEIEKAARLSYTDVMEFDFETRYENACRIQDTMRATFALAA